MNGRIFKKSINFGIVMPSVNQKSDIDRYLADPEYRFLFRCCRAVFSCEEIFYPKDIRQDRFLYILQYHKLAPALYPLLKRCKGLPGHLLKEIQHLLEAHQQKILKLSGELVLLARLFARHQIPWLSVKGPALSVQLYHDVAMRQSNDLDILVNEEDLDQVRRLLKETGYATSFDERNLNGKQYRYVLNHVSDQFFTHVDKKIQIELHWRLTPGKNVEPFNSEFFAATTHVSIAGQAIPTISDTMHVLYLCRHGSMHIWFRLFWLWDVAYALQHMPEPEIKKLFETARKYRMNKILSQSAYLAEQVFGINIPWLHSQYDYPERLVDTALQQIILKNRRSDKLADMWNDFIYRMRLEEGCRNKMAVASLRLTNPSDWATIRLPEQCFFLYFPLKPFILLWRKIKKTKAKKRINQVTIQNDMI